LQLSQLVRHLNLLALAVINHQPHLPVPVSRQDHAVSLEQKSQIMQSEYLYQPLGNFWRSLDVIAHLFGLRAQRLAMSDFVDTGIF
jgi:hypothetical protein